MKATRARPLSRGRCVATPCNGRRFADQVVMPTRMPEGARDLLQSCAAGATQEELSQKLSALSKSSKGELGEDQVELWQSAVFWILTAPHQRPLAAAGALRALGAALASQPPSAELHQKALTWLLEVHGFWCRGRGAEVGDAADTATRWRACHVLDGFLRALSNEGFADLPTELRDACAKILLARCADRCQDVRIAAAESLSFLGAGVEQVVEVLRDRATQDSCAHVRAVCIAGFLSMRAPQEFEELDAELVLRASLDKTSRVRRRLFTTLRTPGAPGRFEDTWRRAVLRGLGDHNKGVRLAATRCLVSDVLSESKGRMPAFLSDADSAAGVVAQIAECLEAVVRRPSLEPSEAERDASALQAVQSLLKRFDVEEALATIGAKSTRADAVFARLTIELAARLSEAPPAGTLVPAIRKSVEILKSTADPDTAAQATFDLCQLFHSSHVSPLPHETSGRMEMVEMAAAAIMAIPVEAAATGRVSGFFPNGREAASMPVMSLAFLLFRRVASADVSNSMQHRGRKAEMEAEATLAMMASGIYGQIRKDAAAADHHLKKRENEMAQLRQDLDDERWSEQARQRHVRVAAGPSTQELEKALERKRSQVEEARDYRDESFLRVLLMSSTWLQYCHNFLSPSQSKLLDEVLLPFVNEQDRSAESQVAAIYGIAIGASKCKDRTRSFWDFFIGILEKLPLTDPSGLGVALRLVEVAILFVCDALLIHAEALRDRRVDATATLARTLRMLDSLQSASRVRSLLLDRCCSLLLWGIAEGAAAAWLLGRLLREVSASAPPVRAVGAEAKTAVAAPAPEKAYLALGLPAPQIAHDAEDDSMDDEESTDAGKAAEDRAVLSARLVRFFVTLPTLSAFHAGLLVAAAEAFFATRMYAPGASDSSKPTPLPSALRAVRFVGARLRDAKAALQSFGADAVAMQLQVMRAVAGALLSGPHVEAKAMTEVLAAGLVVAAEGGPPFDWAGEEAPELREATRALLCDWSPATTAQAATALLSEIHAPGRPSIEAGREFAQDSIDAAAQLRHDLSALGLEAPMPGVQLVSNASNLPKRRVGYWQPRAPSPKRKEHEEAEESDGEFDDEEEELVKRWELIDKAGLRIALVPRGGGLTVGRHPSCDVCVSLPAVSARHCVLSCLAGSGDKESLVLRDLGSSNGTLVNGIHIQSGSELGLSGGDAISLAASDGYSFTVRLSRVAPSATSPPRGKRPMEEEHVDERNVRPRTESEEAPDGQKDAAVLIDKAPAIRRRLRRKTPDPSWLAQDTSKERVESDLDDDMVEVQAEPARSAAVQAEPGIDEVAVAVLQAKEAASSGVPRLVDLSSGQVFPLPEDGIVAIGRRTDCEVVIPRSVVSGRHCVLLCKNGCVQLEDTSSNGTFVNETQVPKGFSLPQRIALRDGDHIYLAQRQGPSLLFLSA
ncbi:Chfr [Symbiodinium sp. CCMP2592]|nr:Chfr [Symbiodinium sp. CCMP2592]